jgi:hypothetical protein
VVIYVLKRYAGIVYSGLAGIEERGFLAINNVDTASDRIFKKNIEPKGNTLAHAFLNIHERNPVNMLQ